MKLNFKSLLIIFLIALLGAGIGTFGVNQFYFNNKGLINNEPLVIKQVNYNQEITGDSISAINKAFDTVVEIYTKKKTTNYYFGNGESQGAGSGVIISEDGYIVTNFHVVNDAYEIVIKLNSGESFEATVIGLDSRSDLALLKIDANNLNYSSFADSDQIVLGQDVIAIGNPLGQGLTASTGIISALEKEIYLNNVYMDLLQTDASINEGNSGGGLFDLNGNIVGIINSKSSSSNYLSATVEGMGYAIPANRAIHILSNLKEYGYVKDRAALGIKTGSASTNSFFYKESNGLLILEVIEGGGAQKAGIQENDLIIEADGEKITTYATLNKVLEKHEIGDTINVKVLRNDKELDFEVTLTETINK